jgi:hypothetical protein
MMIWRGLSPRKLAAVFGRQRSVADPPPAAGAPANAFASRPPGGAPAEPHRPPRPGATPRPKNR